MQTHDPRDERIEELEDIVGDYENKITELEEKLKDAERIDYSILQQLGYNLGYRDALASVLAETKGSIKLPGIATYYESSFKERHFSHEWHTK